MSRTASFFSVLALFAALCLAPGMSKANTLVPGGMTTESPAVLMKHWQESTPDVKSAFLVGFASMLEVERVWQDKANMGLDRSLVKAWGTGLNGVTFQRMQTALDAYAANHPEAMDKPVVEVLWMEFVQPKLTSQMRDQVRKAYYAKELNRR